MNPFEMFVKKDDSEMLSGSEAVEDREVARSSSQEEKEREKESLSVQELDESIEISYLPTIEQLCEQEHVTQDELPQVIERKIQEVMAKVRMMSQSNYLSPELLFVGQCYRALEKVGSADSAALIELKRSLSDYESSKSGYFGDATLSSSQLSLFRGWVTKVCHEIYPGEAMRFKKENRVRSKKRTRRLTYADREEADRMRWVKYGEDEDATTYVTERVSADIASIDKKDFKGYFHSTASSVFEGLIKHGALLSQDRLRERGQEVRTGEGNNELCIYAAAGFNYGYQYSDVSWFNEYPVTFLIDEEQPESFAPDLGIGLGKEVPIQHIKMIFVPSRNMEEAKAMAQENMPWAAVHSIEAGDLLERYYYY